MSAKEIISTPLFQLSYWMFIGGVSIALTGFILGMIVVAQGELQ